MSVIVIDYIEGSFEEREEREYHELLMAKALFYGVKEPKNAKRRR